MPKEKSSGFRSMRHKDASRYSRRGSKITICAAACLAVFIFSSGVFASESKTAQIKISVVLNNPPNSPVLISPKIDENTKGEKNVFKWKYSDPDPKQPQKFFYVEISADNSFKSVDFKSGDVKSSKGQWKFKSPIPEGKWYWRVRATDGYVWSKFSDTWSFNVIKDKILKK